MQETRRFIIATSVLGFVTLAIACERADREPNGLPPRTHPTGIASDDSTGTTWAPVQRMDGGRIGEVAIRTVPDGAALHLRATSLPEGPLSIEVRSEGGGCESPIDQPSADVFRAQIEADGTADLEWVIPGRPGSIYGENDRAVVIVRPASADVACAELHSNGDERPHGSGRPALSPTPRAMPPHSPRGEDADRF